MDSDIDMFNSQPTIGRTPPEQGASCPPVPKFFYGFVILFNWDENKEKHFDSYPRSCFSTQEIPNYWMENKLIDSWRIRKLKPLSALQGQKMSIFGKMESCKN